MSFLSSLVRMVRSVFGLAEGATERATDRLVSSSPEALRAQFRKTRDDWVRDYNQMRESVADLIRIREMRAEEVKKLQAELDQVGNKMAGAIELFKKNPDPRYREAYGQLSAKNEQIEARIRELTSEIEEQQKQIERYKGRLIEFQRQIEGLSKEEAETVADIVSSQKIRELNDRLAGLSQDTQSKNLEAIRTAREKAKAMAKLSSELSGADKSDFDRELEAAGRGSRHLDDFDSAVGRKQPVHATENRPEALPSPAPRMVSPKADVVDVEVHQLLDGVDMDSVKR